MHILQQSAFDWVFLAMFSTSSVRWWYCEPFQDDVCRCFPSANDTAESSVSPVTSHHYLCVHVTLTKISQRRLTCCSTTLSVCKCAMSQ